ncbi:MAG: hypothetical protein ABIX01_15890 [Chitinophagaceae bacterium]
MNRLLPSLIVAIISFYSAPAQRIIYSEPNRDDVRQTNFEIIGKYNSNVLIYKNLRSHHNITAYDIDMKEAANQTLDYLPDRVTNVDFIAYPDYFWMIYQYQRRSIVYCMAAKMGPDGVKIGEPIQMDTTDISYNSSSKLYSLINSEDKQRLMILKVNSKNEKRYMFKTLLFDKDLNMLKISRIPLQMNDRNDILTDFSLDNEGNLVFGHGDRTSNEQNIIGFDLIQKTAQADTFAIRSIKLNDISLDEVKIKADNANRRYVLTSFYYKGKKSIIEGIFHSEWNKATDMETNNLAIPLGEEIRAEARGENNIKNAFNDYYLQNIVIRKDGGFLISAENLYTTSRGSMNPFNRWNYFSQPYLSTADYYYYGGTGWGYPYNRWGSSATRYNADNIVVMSFEKNGKLQWSDIIHKSQFDDDGEATISYQTVNTGDALRFLYNDFEKRDPILTLQSIGPDGKIIRNPTLKNLDKGYAFLPRYAKQTGQKQLIVPCLYRNFLAFAKIEF